MQYTSSWLPSLNTSEWSVIPDELDESNEVITDSTHNENIPPDDFIDKENFSTNLNNHVINYTKRFNIASKDEYYQENPWIENNLSYSNCETYNRFGSIIKNKCDINSARLPLIPISNKCNENEMNHEIFSNIQHTTLNSDDIQHEVVTLKVDINQTTISNDIYLTNTLDGTIKRLFLTQTLPWYVNTYIFLSKFKPNILTIFIRNQEDTRKNANFKSMKDTRNSANSI